MIHKNIYKIAIFSLILLCVISGFITRLSYGKISFVESESTQNANGFIDKLPKLTDGNGLYGIKNYSIPINKTAESLFEKIQLDSSLIVKVNKVDLSKIQNSSILL
jgi:hypothetical protein